MHRDTQMAERSLCVFVLISLVVVSKSWERENRLGPLRLAKSTFGPTLRATPHVSSLVVDFFQGPKISLHRLIIFCECRDFLSFSIFR